MQVSLKHPHGLLPLHIVNFSFDLYFHLGLFTQVKKLSKLKHYTEDPGHLLLSVSRIGKGMLQHLILSSRKSLH